MHADGLARLALGFALAHAAHSSQGQRGLRLGAHVTLLAMIGAAFGMAHIVKRPRSPAHDSRHRHVRRRRVQAGMALARSLRAAWISGQRKRHFDPFCRAKSRALRKMHGTRAMLAEARAIDRAAERLIKVEVALAPPFTLIHATRKEAALIGVGAQDCHPADGGAHTGDISAAMLKDAGAGFTIVGHSERRADHDESDAVVRAKAEAALAAGMNVIVCVGESEAQRDAGEAENRGAGAACGIAAGG